ncbi:MAG: DUF4386 domain-containing protein [Ignavibacteriales bacterium]|nr:DUF4386 domain-containing protein [Ignavibacteriales bacterium]
MNTTLFTDETSPQVYARIAGFLYLLIIVFGLIAQVFVRDGLVDYGNATVTAQKIMDSEFLFRFGFASELIMLICDTAVTMILYVLLRQVSKNIALLATFFRLVSISILGLTALSHYAVVLVLGGANYLTVFEPDQLHALALLSLKLHGSGYNISLLFFGFHLILLGYLLLKSDYLPSILGFLLEIGGACYISNSFIWFLFPTFVTTIYPAILVPCFLGELLLCLWLIVKGVNLSQRESTWRGDRLCGN